MCILNFVDYLVVLKHIKQFSEGKVAAQKRTFRFLHIIVTSKSVNAFVGAFLAFIAVYPLAVITLDFVRSVLQHDFSHEYVLFSCFFSQLFIGGLCVSSYVHYAMFASA